MDDLINAALLILSLAIAAALFSIPVLDDLEKVTGLEQHVFVPKDGEWVELCPYCLTERRE